MYETRIIPLLLLLLIYTVARSRGVETSVTINGVETKDVTTATVFPKDIIKLTWTYQPDPFLGATISKDSAIITPDVRLTYQKSSDSHKAEFTINPVKKTDAGSYKVEATFNNKAVEAATIQLTVKDDPPSALNMNTPSVTWNSITISWQQPNAIDRVQSYEMYLNGELKETIAKTSTQYTFVDLLPNTAHNIAIRTKNPSGSTDFNYTNLLTKKGPVSLPRNVKSDTTAVNEQTISWDHPATTGGVAGNKLIYILAYWKTSSGSDTKVSEPPAEGVTSFIIKLPASVEGDIWSYTLTVTNKAGASTPGSVQILNGMFMYTLNAKPSPLTINIEPTSKTSFMISWNAPPFTVLHYKFKINSTLRNVNIDRQIPGEMTSFNVTGLTADSTYTITAYAVNKNGDGNKTTWTATTRKCGATEFQCLTDKQCLASKDLACNNKYDCTDKSDETFATPCALPKDFIVESIVRYKSIDFNVTITNKNNVGRVVVVVEIDDKNAKNVTLPDGVKLVGIKQSTTSTGFMGITSTSFVPGTKTNVYIYGISLVGNGTITKTELQTLGPLTDEPPTLISNLTTTSSLTVSITVKSTQRTSFSIGIEYRHEGIVNISRFVGTVNDTFKLMDLNYSTRYDVRFNANDGDGYSDFSPWAMFRTRELALPEQLKKLTLYARRNSIEVEWSLSKEDFVYGYNLQYKPTHNDTWNDIKIDSPETLKHIIDNLTPDTDYEVQIAAVNPKYIGVYLKDVVTTDPNICPGADWKFFHSYCYYLSEKTSTFQDSMEKCQQMTSSLVSIATFIENKNIHNEISRVTQDIHPYYLGLRQKPKNNFTWIDGTVFVFNSYKEINATSTVECNTMSRFNRQWYPASCQTQNRYICKRLNTGNSPLKLVLKTTGYDKLTFELLTTTHKRNPVFRIHVIGDPELKLNVSAESMSEIVVPGLKEATEYKITIQEDFNGLGPASAEQTFKTRLFMLPGAVVNITEQSIMYAESRHRQITWDYGTLGDSSPDDIQTELEYCNGGVCKTMKMNETSALLTGLEANTTYEYSLKVFDRMRMKYGNASMIKMFTTSVNDTCKTTEWLCTGSWKCVSKNQLCDNVFDCPRGVMGVSVDEQKIAGCNVSSKVNVTDIIKGFQFLRITWQPLQNQRVRSYVIIVNGNRHSVAGNKTTHRISGLVNMTIVEYTILAVNPSGDGQPFSENVTLTTTIVATTAVESLMAKPIQAMENNQQKISWEIPQNVSNNDPMKLTYHITWCLMKDQSNCSMMNVTEQLSYVIPDLLPYTNYTVSVVVINEYGQSSPTESTMFMTTQCTSTEFECVTDRMCINKTMACDGVTQCTDKSDESADAGCALAPPLKLEKYNIGIKFISVKFMKPVPTPQQITFTLENEQNVILQKIKLTTNVELNADGVVTFTMNITAGSKYMVQGYVHNFIGKNNGTVLDVETLASHVKPGLPRTVSSETKTYRESSSVRINWQHPQHTGGVLASELIYQISYVNNDDNTDTMTILTKVKGVEFHMLTGLMPNSMYNISVSALSTVDKEGPMATIMYVTNQKDTCKNNSTDFRCPVLCLEMNRLCDGRSECRGDLDESKTANCSEPPMISTVNVNSTWNSLTLSWETPEKHPRFYHLMLSCNSSIGDVDVTVPKNTTSYKFDGVTTTSMPANCSFVIMAENYAGNSSKFMQYFTTPTLAASSAPLNNETEAVLGFESSKVTLTWDTPSDLSNVDADEMKYLIEWCINKKQPCMKKTVNTTSAMLESLEKNSNYIVTITPINPIGQQGESIQFAFVTAEQDQMPSVPLNVVVVKHDDTPQSHMIVTWEPPANHTRLNVSFIKYTVKYCIKPKLECKISETEAGVTRIVIGGLESRQLYEVHVAAIGRNGKAGPFSEVNEHETEESGLRTWEIALIIIGALIVLIIIIAIVARVHFKTRYPKTYDPKDPKETSRMNPSYQDDRV